MSIGVIVGIVVSILSLMSTVYFGFMRLKYMKADLKEIRSFLPYLYYSTHWHLPPDPAVFDPANSYQNDTSKYEFLYHKNKTDP